MVSTAPSVTAIGYRLVCDPENVDVRGNVRCERICEI